MPLYNQPQNSFYNSEITSTIEWNYFQTLLTLECAKKQHT